MTTFLEFVTNCTITFMCPSAGEPLAVVTMALGSIGRYFPRYVSTYVCACMSVSVMQAGVTCTSFLTTQLESGNWRKRTTTWRLNSQPTP